MKTPENGLKHYLSTKLIRHREEPVPPIFRLKRKADRKKFDKLASVFAAWRLDEDNILANCIKHDKMYWKVPKFVKAG